MGAHPAVLWTQGPCLSSVLSTSFATANAVIITVSQTCLSWGDMISQDDCKVGQAPQPLVLSLSGPNRWA